MEPNSTDQNQQDNQPSAVPQPSVLPTPPVLPPAPQFEQPIQPASYAPAPVPVPQPAKSKKGLIIALAVGIPVLVLAFIGVLFGLVIYPAMQSQAVASGFMADVTSGNVDAAVQATGDTSSRSFLTSSSAKLKGNSYKLSATEYNGEGNSYYLYTLTGNTYVSARVIVVKSSGKRLVNSFVYDTQALALKPTTASTSTQNSTSTATTESTTASTSCLDSGSFTALASFAIEPYSDGRYVWTDNIFFMPDSTSYNYESVVTEQYDKYKAFYQQNSTKQFTVDIAGTVYSASPDDALANSRAQKVKSDLISKSGIPAEMITVSAPDHSLNYDQAAARNVDIEIKSPDSCKTSNG